jgi:3-oxoacyl-[acyl-carrier-protein] synthase III
MPVHFDSAFVNSTGLFLPGPPVGNDELDQYIAPLTAASGRIKRRILAENGIRTRHYAIGPDGSTLHTAAQMAANAVRDCLAHSEVGLSDLNALCTGTSGGDMAMPGFANMVQGELHAGPLHTSSHQGVCASGVAALQHAASTIELGGADHAMVVAADFPSRMFKRSRFAPRGYETDFASHFLRWMLSDGAGACLLGGAPRRGGVSLRLRWIHSRSFSGDLPVCMQIGQNVDGSARSYLDYPSLAEAEADGAFLLRQDIRLLPHLFEVGILEYAELIRRDLFHPNEVDHFLCHYSSQKFAGVVEELMCKAGLSIPTQRWYSNLQSRGNTGAASIFVMLADFMRARALKPGQRVLCFVPESGRFTVAFMLLEAVTAGGAAGRGSDAAVSPPHDPQSAAKPRLRALLQELASIWHDYRSRVWRTRLISTISDGRFTCEDYTRWMSSWIPQVREGSVWMRTAARNLDGRHAALASLVETHAGDEQSDYAILFEDYQLAGGRAERVGDLRRNPGGEALNSYLQALARQPNPLGLLGAVYIIEGTGQRIIPALLPLLRRQLKLPDRAFRFLAYHGENDVNHLTRWLQCVELALAADPACDRQIADVARSTADLYRLQMENAL